MTLIQTKQKRAAREQRNNHKPRTETSTNQEQKQEQHLPIRHASRPADWGDAADWTWLDNWLLSEEVWFLLAILGTSSVSTSWFTFVCRYCWLTWNGFGPSAAFRFQVRVCVDISCPVQQICRTCTTYSYFFFTKLEHALTCFQLFGWIWALIRGRGKGILKLNPLSMELSKSMGPDHGNGWLHCPLPSPHEFSKGLPRQVPPDHMCHPNR